ncbi:hypothetical protein [Polyangium mundeleinium]|uniref:Uncharacterized protein n=1 Tax=Polyangium mundeleinium TaxID=2995306 RepID=A0ABT5F5D4_9BACT|nr:hypothetical protein [Polyangium mundeleinium]MDC0749300.1 hypothetical protein [Polyangium mundeleinium]
MRNLTLSDLRAGLLDLFHHRDEALTATQTGKLYGPILAAKRKAIEHLEDAAGRPVGDLTEADAHHDGLGAAIWHYTEAVLSHPFVPEERREAARRIREAFIRDLGVLSDSYAEEAAAAKQNRPKLAELEADLRAAPTPDGKTLYDWASAFVEQGDKLAQLLSTRGQATGFEYFRQQTALRVTTIGQLGRFRAALRDELVEHPDLPRDLDERIFGGFDELTQKRAEAKENARK